MTTKSWIIHVTGLVTRLRSDGARVAVPHGNYIMMETGGVYEITREGGPSFSLSINEMSQYVRDRHLKVEGSWP